MAAIQAHLERESGMRLMSVYDLVGVADFVRSRSKDTTCVRFIDPVGETVFNRGQCEILQREWASLTDGAPAEIELWINEVARLIERCRTEIHLYLRFSGD